MGRTDRTTTIRPGHQDPHADHQPRRRRPEPENHPTGGHFLVKDYPKDKEYRRFKLTRQITDKLTAHIAEHRISTDDLLFSTAYQPTRPTRPTRAEPHTLGMTEPDAHGRRHWHGTTSAYASGCRCLHCRAILADYRAERRANGKDAPRTPRTRTTDGHIGANWFRNQIWQPALEHSNIGIHVRIHDLRHAHASSLLPGGADLQVVKEQLGHANISTTALYSSRRVGADMWPETGPLTR